MKNIFLIVPCLFALLAVANTESRNALLELKDESAHLVFQDHTLEAEEKELIVDDLNLVLGHLDQIAPYPSVRDINLSLSGNEATVEWHPGFAGGARIAPDDFFSQFWFGYGPEGNRHLIITEELSERYQDALQQKGRHEDLQLFLSALRSRGDLPFPMEERLWFHSSFPDDEKLRKKITGPDNPFRLEWRDPSLLDIHQISDQGEKELLGRWIADIYFFDEHGELRKWWIPFIYDNGIWKVVIATPGT